jgi:aryl-alcohol dehydrogenase-like predicted oxidoreductase
MGYDPRARRRLGSAPLEVTQLGLGCGPIGGFRAPLTEDEAAGILRTAHDEGVGLFDTAPLYGYGQSAGHRRRHRPPGRAGPRTKSRLGRYRGGD